MSDDTDTPDGVDRESITPGGGEDSALIDSVDPDFDYDEAAEDWDGSPVSAECTIEAPGDDKRAPKKFVFVEPDQAGVATIAAAFNRGDKRAIVDAIVASPRITEEFWENKLTGRDQFVLYDQCLTWAKCDVILGLDSIQMFKADMGRGSA